MDQIMSVVKTVVTPRVLGSTPRGP